MKKQITLIALIAAMFTANATVANAQMDYDKINYRLAETHTKEYINKGDDAYRMGNYKEAMDFYKKAREYNTFKGKPVVPERDIDQKMDRCGAAIRNGSDQETRRNREEASAIIDALFGLGKDKSSRSSSSSPASGVRKVTYNDLTYITTVNNSFCHILGVTSDRNGTVVEMEYLNLEKDDRIKIDKNTYIKDTSTGMKLMLQEVENITTRDYMPVECGDAHVFRLYFQRLSNNCTEIDIVEPGSSSWKFYHVPVNE